MKCLHLIKEIFYSKINKKLHIKMNLRALMLALLRHFNFSRDIFSASVKSVTPDVYTHLDIDT